MYCTSAAARLGRESLHRAVTKELPMEYAAELNRLIQLGIIG
jgi:Fe-S cluster assembly scaffold protein SufB